MDLQIGEVYKFKMPFYERLGNNLKVSLELLLKEAQVKYFSIYYRVKELDSFTAKSSRKEYAAPLNEIEDICGIRIICYYQSDIKIICEIIRSEFNIINETNKEEQLGIDKFGYRSHHFVVTVKDTWLEIPNYRGLKDFKAEIQIRTVLMHGWAEIEHGLNYKAGISIPDKLKRIFARVSAKLEEADEQFEEIKQEINNYKKQVSESLEQNTKTEESINYNNLLAMAELRFSDREEIEGLDADAVNRMINLLNEQNYTINKLDKIVTSKMSTLEKFEELMINQTSPTIPDQPYSRPYQLYSAFELIFLSILLTDDKIWEVYKPKQSLQTREAVESFR